MFPSHMCPYVFMYVLSVYVFLCIIVFSLIYMIPPCVYPSIEMSPLYICPLYVQVFPYIYSLVYVPYVCTALYCYVEAAHSKNSGRTFPARRSGVNSKVKDEVAFCGLPPRKYLIIGVLLISSTRAPIGTKCVSGVGLSPEGGCVTSSKKTRLS